MSQILLVRWLSPALFALAFAGLSLAGCGITGGSSSHGVRLLVTRDFGTRPVDETYARSVDERETVMGLLTQTLTVGRSAATGSLRSIDGISGEVKARPADWFYYVNGVEATTDPASTNVHAGDHIWWDLHDSSQAKHVPAVVGAFPEPFLDGTGGHRLPVRIECANVFDRACHAVTAQLRSAGVPAAIGPLGMGRQPETLRVLVGPWASLATDPTASSIAQGPGASGVYARFSADGQTLTPLAGDGRPGRVLTSGAGLIAATRQSTDAPIWVVTGTDPAGVDLAAHAFDQTTLRDRFAVALTAAGALPLPVTIG